MYHRWEWQFATEIPLLPSFVYLLNKDESLASPCVLARIDSKQNAHAPSTVTPMYEKKKNKIK